MYPSWYEPTSLELRWTRRTFCRTLYRLSYTATLTKFLTHRKLPKRKAWIQFFNSIWRSSWVCFSSSRSMWYFTLIKPENKSFYFELLPASGCLIFSHTEKYGSPIFANLTIGRLMTIRRVDIQVNQAIVVIIAWWIRKSDKYPWVP